MLRHILEGLSMFRTAYNYDTDAASEEAGLFCADKSLAIQSQRDESDINTIVRRFGITGEIPVKERIPLNIDIDEVIDYKSCMDFLLAADKSFMSLPAQVRATFDNDAGRFVDFAGDPQNLPQLREWGLAPVAAEAPDPVPATSSGGSPSSSADAGGQPG